LENSGCEKVLGQVLNLEWSASAFIDTHQNKLT
jgi:hypothetical protein